jgi:hypothetical protein
MPHTRTHLLVLLLCTAPALAGAQGGALELDGALAVAPALPADALAAHALAAPRPAGGGVSAEVRAALSDALEAHATPPPERPRLPDAATPAPLARSGGKGSARGVEAREKATEQASTRARVVLDALREGRSPARADGRGEGAVGNGAGSGLGNGGGANGQGNGNGRNADVAAGQERVKRARGSGPNGKPPGLPGRPDAPGKP